jgi:bifunctional DNA-binding transcriptional regulator/antitoxin component of YhaV-PrlF toxin-antitoxin module
MGNRTTILYGTPGQFKVAIPKALAQAMGLKKGERVEWILIDLKNLRLKRLENNHLPKNDARRKKN